MRYFFVVHTNSVAGKDAEFNVWYDGQHIPDVLDVPGFIAAQRFRATDAQIAPVSHTYFTLYEIESSDLEKSLAEFRARGGTPKMVMTNSVDFSTASMAVYAPVGPRVTSEETAAKRTQVR